MLNLDWYLCTFGSFRIKRIGLLAQLPLMSPDLTFCGVKNLRLWMTNLVAFDSFCWLISHRVIILFLWIWNTHYNEGSQKDIKAHSIKSSGLFESSHSLRIINYLLVLFYAILIPILVFWVASQGHLSLAFPLCSSCYHPNWNVLNWCSISLVNLCLFLLTYAYSLCIFLTLFDSVHAFRSQDAPLCWLVAC